MHVADRLEVALHHRGGWVGGGGGGGGPGSRPSLAAPIRNPSTAAPDTYAHRACGVQRGRPLPAGSALVIGGGRSAAFSPSLSLKLALAAGASKKDTSGACRGGGVGAADTVGADPFSSPPPAHAGAAAPNGADSPPYIVSAASKCSIFFLFSIFFSPPGPPCLWLAAHPPALPPHSPIARAACG